DNAADIRLNAMWGIVFSTLSPMYEFSHSLGHKRTNHRWPKSIAVRFGPKADIRRGIGTTGCTALQRERDMCAQFSAPATSPSLLAYGWGSTWLLFEGFNMAARETLIGDQFAHCAEARHPANRHRAFAQTGTIVGQFSKLRQNSAH